MKIRVDDDGQWKCCECLTTENVILIETEHLFIALCPKCLAAFHDLTNRLTILVLTGKDTTHEDS